MSTETLETPVIKEGRGRSDPHYTSDIIKVPSYNPIKSRAAAASSCVSGHASVSLRRSLRRRYGEMTQFTSIWGVNRNPIG